MTSVEAYTDGACRGNPGPGGWGVLLRCGETEKTLSGYVPETTNNRMELLAAIMALSELKKTCRVKVVTDSQYVRQGITAWLLRWKQQGWKTAAKQPVKNQDLWQRLDALAAQHQVEWCWVKGHSGHLENDRVDALARAAIDQQAVRS